MASPIALESLLADLRARVGSTTPYASLGDLGVQIWRIADPSDLPRGGAHLGVDIRIPALVRTPNGGGRRRKDEDVFGTSTIQVTLYVRARAGTGRAHTAGGSPPTIDSGWGATEDQALTTARTIRKRITGDYAPITPAACVVGGLEWISQTQGPHPATKGWYRVIMQFSATYLVDIGE